MSKDIRTHEANLEMVSKFLQYAHIANASYVMLHYVFEGK